MKCFFIAVIVFFCFHACVTSDSELSCDTFRKGKFMIQLDFPPYHVTYIDRNDSIQTEFNPITRDTLVQAIKWTSSCDYELKFLKQNRIKADSLEQMLDSKILKTKILKTGKGYYVFKSYYDGIDFSFIDTVKILP